MRDTTAPIGGAFLNPRDGDAPEAIFTPEQLPSDARLMAKAVEDFIRGEVLPVNSRLEAHEPGLMHGLLKRAGELGILGMAVPERYGGLDLPKSQIALLTEILGLHPSFAISAGVHAGVATLPLLLFGTEAQKQRYLPKLASGEWIGAFALSEAGSGSDALAAQTKAVLSPDGGHYILNGTKMWITNGGFADVFTLFARTEDGRLTAFLVDRTSPGLVAEREEEKLGLRGSSTTRVVLDNVRVPAENVLGEVGKGHRPALYALNLGRFAIAATALGMCKENLRIATRYAKERRQFGKPIAEFGLVGAKLAEMAIRTFALESMVYRTAGYLDAAFGAVGANALTQSRKDAKERKEQENPSLHGAGGEEQEALRAAAEEYAIECAVCKVFATETLDFVVDEALQIHGGYGFSEEFAVAQAYRDARVFRIFEGTNEINRLTIVDQILRRTATGRLKLDARHIGRTVHQVHEVYYATAVQAIQMAQDRFSDSLMVEQEVVGCLAELIIDAYAADSAMHRSNQTGHSAALAAAGCFAAEAMPAAAAQSAAVAHACGDGTVRSITLPATDTIALRRQVAQAVLERDGYPW